MWKRKILKNDKINDVISESEKKIDDIRNLDPPSVEMKKRVMPKRAKAILGEIKRRFDSDR